MIRPILIVALFALSCCATTDQGGDRGGGDRAAALAAKLAGPDGTMLVVAHRGCWQGTAENSLEGIDACVAAGVDMVEIDVRRSRDGRLVIIHDDNVDRTTDGHGKVADLTSAQLGKLRLRVGAGGPTARLTAYRIPTIETALDRIRGRILVNLDAKTDVRDQAAQAVVKRRMGRQVLFKSDAPAAAIRTTRWLSTAAFQPILTDDPNPVPLADRIAAYRALSPVGYELVFHDVTFLRRASADIRAAGVRVWVNTMDFDIAAGLIDRKAMTDPDAIWGTLADVGVDAIQTDRPVELITWLHRGGARRIARPKVGDR